MREIENNVRQGPEPLFITQQYKAIPAQAYSRSWRFSESEAPNFLNILNVELVKFSALRTGSIPPAPFTHFC
jgi:hypothetical protein